MLHVNRLPSLHALRAFEAAARLGGFKQAATELHVTPTAISHHIRGLEGELGFKLFTRQTRKVRLTDEGRQLAQACANAFGQLGDTIKVLREGENRYSVRLAMGPFVASRWLTPRLTKFWRAFPNVDLQLLHTPVRFDPSTIDADLVIAWEEGTWPGWQTRPLLEVSAIPVASPELVSRYGMPQCAEDLLRFPLIHQRNKVEWQDWFLQNQVADALDLAGVVIEDANVVLSSACEGQGVALGWLPFLEPEIREGRLLRLSEVGLDNARTYYLLERSTPQQSDVPHQVSVWLQQEAS